MYFYFSSEYPAALKIGGIYYGQIFLDVKGINLDLANPVLIEICPMKKKEEASCFIIDDCFPKNFDALASVTDLDGGFFIKFKKTAKIDETFVLAQEKFTDIAVSVFNQSGLKISLETRCDFFAEDVCGDFSSASVKKFILDGKELVLICLGNQTEKCLLIYDYQDKIRRIFYDKVSDFSLENGFNTTMVFFDVLKHKVEIKWEYADGKLKQKEKNVSSKKTFDPCLYNEKIIPYVFMEELLVGGDCKPFLTDDLKNSADKLPAFFDGVIGIMPPPAFKDDDLIGLIYKTGLDRYLVKYLKVSLTDKLICDIKII